MEGCCERNSTELSRQERAQGAPGASSELTLKSKGISSLLSPKYSMILRGSGSSWDRFPVGVPPEHIPGGMWDKPLGHTVRIPAHPAKGSSHSWLGSGDPGSVTSLELSCARVLPPSLAWASFFCGSWLQNALGCRYREQIPRPRGCSSFGNTPGIGLSGFRGLEANPARGVHVSATTFVLGEETRSVLGL